MKEFCDDFKSTFKKVDDVCNDEKCSNFLHKWMFLYKKYFNFEIKNESVVSLGYQIFLRENPVIGG